jgi:hypothetical protein
MKPLKCTAVSSEDVHIRSLAAAPHPSASDIRDIDEVVELQVYDYSRVVLGRDEFLGKVPPLLPTRQHKSGKRSK